MVPRPAVRPLTPCSLGILGRCVLERTSFSDRQPSRADSAQFQTAAWGAYATSMISEVVPAPKVYMFFALFNTVGKTSGFIGPFISSAIIKRAGGNTNASFWFLFAMGSVSLS